MTQQNSSEKISPQMKMKEIIKKFFGNHFHDEDSNAAYCLYAMHEFFNWYLKEEQKKEISIPPGFKVSHHNPAEFLTDECNAQNKWSVERMDAPFCGKDQVRIWTGPTMEEALKKACISLNIPL